MNKPNIEKQDIAALVEGKIRSTVRMIGVAKNTIVKLLAVMHYNFCRIHQSLRVTPAMEAGIADHIWSIEEVLALLK